MDKDLRRIFAEERAREKMGMPDGHVTRFRQKLDKALPGAGGKRQRVQWRSMAAVIVVGILLAMTVRNLVKRDRPEKPPEREIHVPVPGTISIGDLSPDLKNLETYYLANINLELSRLEVSGVDRPLVDHYMDRLARLDTEYKRLNDELNQVGPNDQTINALLNNLKLRLRLLQRLKEKLNELKSNKDEPSTFSQL